MTFDERMTAVTLAIEQHHPFILRYLTNLCKGDHATAEDLASKLWVYVLHRFEPQYLASIYLIKRKAFQIFLDQWRRQRRQSQVLEFTAFPPELAVQHLPREAHTFEEEVYFKKSFFESYPVEGLTKSQRDCLWLHARYGFTINEISRKMNVPSSTIGDWLLLGRKKFAEHLNNLP